MSSKVKIGIVGTGRMGALHLAKFQSLPKAEVVGIYEPNIERAHELIRTTSVKAFSSIEELIFNVDGLVIATPTSTHFSIAKSALSHGCHVLIEKPFCETLEEAYQLEQLAKSKGLICQIGFLERFRFEALMGTYTLSRFSKIQAQRLSTTVGREVSVDVVSDLMIHDVDLVLSIANEEPTRVTATGFSVVTDYIDFATAKLEFSSGIVAELTASRVSSIQKRSFQIISRGLSCELDFVTNSKFFLERAGEDTRSNKTISFDALEAQSTNFIEAIMGRTTPKVPAQDGYRVISTIEKIKTEVYGEGAKVFYPKTLEISAPIREQ